MKRAITFSFYLLLLVAFSFSGFAQEISNVTSLGDNNPVYYGPANHGPSNGDVPCTEENPNDFTFENGINCSSTSLFQTANDLTVAADEDFELSQITASIFANGGITLVDVIYYDDAAGLPGAVIGSEAGIVPTSQVVIGSNFGFDVNEIVLDVTPFTFAGQAGVPTTYWVELSVTDGGGTGSVFWVVTSSSAVGFGTAIFDAGWSIFDPLFDGVYIWGGDCTPIGGACGLLTDNFDVDIAQWTEVGGLGVANWVWVATNNAAGTAPGELNFHWSPSFTGDSYLMSPVLPSAGFINTTISFEHLVDWFGGAGTIGVATTTDGGTSWTSIWSIIDPPAGIIGPENVTVPFTGDANLQIGFYWMGNSFNINEWYIDDLCVDGIVPVELTSFTASVNERNVTLDWTTATEINNQGFEIERNSGSGFENIGYVAGFGTSAEPHSYSFTDASVNEGTHSYRLKQLDFDGTFEYFDAIEVDIAIPDVFALEQNYPNPFNPSTKIDFSLAVDSDVSLKVFDVLGQEVATLINTNLVAGSHNVDFNASLLNSGVYFYRIEATGIDGTNFTNVKKMILTK